MAPSAAFATLVVGASAGYQCPGSGSAIHASMKVTSTASASCSDVQAEIEARAQGKNGFVDPHNGGIYSVLASQNGLIQTQRTTNPATSVGGQLYTDKQTFVLSDTDGGCKIESCSESQGTSVGDFSTNYCDQKNLYCGSADGCVVVSNDFSHSEDSHKGSIGAGHDLTACIVKAELKSEVAKKYQCPGSGSFVHASMEVTAKAAASCSDVQAEIESRANGEGGWVDPHNGGIYSTLSSSNGVIQTQRTTNPATSVGGKLYTDKQTWVLSDVDGGCQIEGCSESQGSSVGDFSTNYCDLRNLYCGSAEGCTPVSKDFTHEESEHTGSIGAGHDSGNCIVTKSVSV
jgi:hypothetical protein